MSNIMDVANKAKVSKATVSRYINNKKVSEQKSIRIQKAIDELNFTPNRIAQGLSNKQSDLIGIIVPDLLNPFFSEIVSEVEKCAHEDNFNCLVFSSQNQVELEKNALKVCQNFSVKGVVLITSYNDIKLADYLFPIVCVDRYVATSKKNIIIDNVKIGEMIGEYFLSNNCNKILYIEGNSLIDTTITRRAGFKKYANDNEIKFDVVSTCYDDVKQVSKDLKKISNINDYDGIYMGNEIIAFALLNEDIKEDIVKLTIDGTYLNNFLLEKIKTIKQPIMLFAKVAYQKIINWDNKKETIYLEVSKD